MKICEQRAVNESECKNACAYYDKCYSNDTYIAGNVNLHNATEIAYRNGYEKGHEDSKKQSKWISVRDRLPEPEVEVIVLAERNGYSIITTAMYEDGTISTEDSNWNWWDLDFVYDKENDCYLIPEGWWEYRHYNPDDVCNNVIDDEVTHWMPLPSAEIISKSTRGN